MNQSELEAHIVAGWQNPEHDRQRTLPRSSDVQYFVFADLNDFLKQHATDENIVILDFGAGSSPYKSYFPNADYRRADVIDMPGLRYQICPDGRVRENDATFDLIISTQVLEHVREVHQYLVEARRLLKPGGRLLLTTHGIWEEHGVPYDFQRWTEEGMKRDLSEAGFGQFEIYKMTAGFRAALFLFIVGLFTARPPRSAAARFLFKTVRYVISKLFPMLYRFCDRHWPEDKIAHVGKSPVNPVSYLILGVIATK